MKLQRNHVLFSTNAFTSARSELDAAALGRDLARALADWLQRAGYVLPSAPIPEDWGWSVEVHAKDERHLLSVGLMDGCERAQPRWLAWLTRERGVAARLLGRDKEVSRSLLQAVHEAIMGLPNVSDVQWFRESDFLAGSQDAWASTPSE